MTIYILPFANKLSSSYSKKVSFTNKSCKANNQYVRKIGVGVDNSQTTYDLKYVGLTEVELAEVETLFSVQALGDLVSFKSPIDAIIGYYFKPTAWRKSRYYKILANNTRVKVYDMEFTLVEGNRLANVLIPIDPVPTYLVNVATTDVYEPYTLACTVTTSSVPDGTTLYWTIHNITTSSTDVTPQSGAISITSSSASFFVGIVADALIEGVETFQVQLRLGGTTGGVVAVSPVVSIRSEIVANPSTLLHFSSLPPTDSATTPITPTISTTGTLSLTSGVFGDAAVALTDSTIFFTPSVGNFAESGDFTFRFRYKTDGRSYTPVIHNGSAVDYLYIQAGTYRIGTGNFDNTDTGVVAASASFDAISLERKDGILYLYVNGTLVGSRAYTRFISNEPIFIELRLTTIDEFAYFLSTALTAPAPTYTIETSPY